MAMMDPIQHNGEKVMGDWDYDEHIALTRKQRLARLNMCEHGLWLHEKCHECPKPRHPQMLNEAFDVDEDMCFDILTDEEPH